MISPLQLLLARTMCGWNLDDAAKRFGISRPTLTKYESGEVGGQYERRGFIQSVYEAHGVVFTPAGGVEPGGKGILELVGRDGFAWFRQDVLMETRKNNPDICVSDVDERLFDEWGAGKVNDEYRSEMAKLVEENSEIRARFLIRETDEHVPAKRHAEYRWIPEGDFGDFPLYMYGNKTAIILFGNGLDIIILNHPKITRFYRKLFNEKWARADSITAN